MAKKKKSAHEQEQNREYQKEYYAKNKDKLAEDRARRYREDPEYAKRMKNAAKRRFWLGTRPATTGEHAPTLPDVALSQIAPKGLIPVVVDNSDDHRHGTTIEVPVYTTAALEVLLGRMSQTIRVWLKEGILPEPFYRGRMVPLKVAKGRNPRLFTQDEMEAIEACKANLTLPSHGKKHDIFTRCVRERFESMVQGLAPSPSPEFRAALQRAVEDIA